MTNNSGALAIRQSNRYRETVKTVVAYEHSI